jgi:hypothetical protein
VVVHRILRSHLGRAFEALRGSPIASDCMGVSVYRYKVYAFVISAGFAGLAGSLYAYSEQYISPNTYNFELTVLFLLAVIMGGRKSRTRRDAGRGHHRAAAQAARRHRAVPLLRRWRWPCWCWRPRWCAGARQRDGARRWLVPVVGSIALAVLAFWLEP